ncbi:hypothetical protein BJ944DRAFT_165793 [Cunninghamella echinulata]|nr:hypothetical protein BJ944DRAFT_165793 [Cunninghamella echinulata]
MTTINSNTTDNNNTNNNNNNALIYSYDCELGRWNTFSIPNSYLLKRQGASSTVLENGTAYIWGGKHLNSNKINTTDEEQKKQLSYMYRLDSIYPSNSTIIYTLQNTIPPVRYQHTQTLIGGHSIVILGGFDGLTGSALSLTDIWLFDTNINQWSHITAMLGDELELSNRSSHSQVLMPDETSILIFGGYDGYHVFNDVAVLDTKSWTWTIKNTNAVVQGRADVSFKSIKYTLYDLKTNFY